jgi:hypothetical protein
LTYNDYAEACPAIKNWKLTNRKSTIPSGLFVPCRHCKCFFTHVDIQRLRRNTTIDRKSKIGNRKSEIGNRPSLRDYSFPAANCLCFLPHIDIHRFRRTTPVHRKLEIDLSGIGNPFTTHESASRFAKQTGQVLSLQDTLGITGGRSSPANTVTCQQCSICCSNKFIFNI